VRIVLNRLAAAGSKTGIGHYAAQLLRCLRAQAEPDAVEGFPRGWVRRAHAVGGRLRALLEPKKRLSGPGPRPAGPPLPPWRRRLVDSLRRCGRRLLERHFRALCTRRSYDLYHEPNFVPLPCDLPTVVTVPDLSVLLHPEWHPADRVAHFERRFRRGLGQCAHVLAISEFCRQEIIQTFNLSPRRVTHTCMGVRPGLGPMPEEEVRVGLRRRGLPPRYLLYLGTLEPRKNVLTLLRAYCTLPTAVRDRWPLLLAGGWGWNTSELAAYLHDEARHRGVVHLGYAAEADLALLFNGARALAYPSFYEGFGLPPMEMLACGGAVLASTAGAVAETVGGQAHLIDARDLDGWRAALLRVATDDDWWAQLRRGAAAAARPFTWERCAAETLAVYRHVAGQAQQPRRAG
jgi:alpha-1,3-rhamnosyl/mannosyltransferase